MENKEAIEYLENSRCDQKKGDELQEYHNKVLDMAIESLKNQGCGCGICLTHNNMKCPLIKT